MKVLVKPNGKRGKRVYHLPDEENPTRPRCRRNEKRTDYRPVERDLFPGLRQCKYCAGEIDNTGPQLANVLAKMDPEEIGGGTA